MMRYKSSNLLLLLYIFQWNMYNLVFFWVSKISFWASAFSYIDSPHTPSVSAEKVL